MRLVTKEPKSPPPYKNQVTHSGEKKKGTTGAQGPAFQGGKGEHGAKSKGENHV